MANFSLPFISTYSIALFHAMEYGVHVCVLLFGKAFLYYHNTIYLKLHRMSCLQPLMVTSIAHIETIYACHYAFSNGKKAGSAVFSSLSKSMQQLQNR